MDINEQAQQEIDKLEARIAVLLNIISDDKARIKDFKNLQKPLSAESELTGKCPYCDGGEYYLASAQHGGYFKCTACDGTGLIQGGSGE